LGQRLIERFTGKEQQAVVSLDLRPLPDSLRMQCVTALQGDILDDNLLQRLVSEFEIHAIYHLAALLSTRAEYTPDIAHQVNVQGTLNLLRLAHEQAQWHGNPVQFLFPSSIAVYGLPDTKTKNRFGRVREHDWNFPTTMYGCNKCYCEQVGRYYALHFRQLAGGARPSGVDFRAVRFPGLISAVTIPSGGTSDYAAEMIHAAAQGKPYACFVNAESCLPFMAMPDAVKALIQIAQAPAERLTQRVYNIGAFSLSAEQLRRQVLEAFPAARISFEPDPLRARIVDTWPADVNDEAARRDWDWQPDYNAARAFTDYLIPGIKQHYESGGLSHSSFGGRGIPER
jgi:nucleoside-diphosphate-sugar epimerase